MTVSHLIVFFTKAINSSVSTSCYVHLVTAGCSDSPLCLLRCKQYTESVTKPLCSCTMNSWTFLFQFPISKRFGKGQAHPKNTWHNWMNHMSITVNHGIASTNQINKRRGLPPTEPVGKSNSYWNQLKKENIVSILQIQLPCKDTSLQHHTFVIHFTFPKNLQLLQFGLGRFEILIIFQLLNAARLLSPLATIGNLKKHVLYTAHNIH